MAALRIGCQTYTWQMSYDRYSQRLDHIMDVVAEAGFAGIEPEVCMLGPYRRKPGKLAEELAARNLELAALCLVCDWLDSREQDAERAEADLAIEYLRHFPHALLILCQMPGEDRNDLELRQQNCISCCNAIGRRAAEAGIATAFHPNSPAGSVFRTEADYRTLMEQIDSEFVGFAPDSGHISKGGMDAVAIFRRYRDLIRHVHFKDMADNGTWAAMGQGAIDFPALVRDLREMNFAGWVMVEDESPRAEDDPDAVTRDNGLYVATHLSRAFRMV